MWIKKLCYDESAQGLIEYSLILSLIAIAVIGAVILLGGSVFDLYQSVEEDVTNAL